jgi:hypothetical protein
VPNKMGGLSVGRSLFHAHFDQSSSPFWWEEEAGIIPVKNEHQSIGCKKIGKKRKELNAEAWRKVGVNAKMMRKDKG